MTIESKWDPVEFLKKTHTKVLMNYRDACYRVSGKNKYDIPDDECHYNPFDNHGDTVTLAQIKTELSTREHIPNKTEAKVLRQQRAHAGKNR